MGLSKVFARQPQERTSLPRLELNPSKSTPGFKLHRADRTAPHAGSYGRPELEKVIYQVATPFNGGRLNRSIFLLEQLAAGEMRLVLCSLGSGASRRCALRHCIQPGCLPDMQCERVSAFL